MRRAVVTPTFAAGLGVVVAAALGYQTRTVFSYSAPGGQPCQVVRCGLGTQGGGTPAQARPGTRLQAPSPSTDLPAGVPGASPKGASVGKHRKPAPASQRNASFQVVDQSDKGWVGEITISFPNGSRPDSWQLAFAYSSARITGVWYGQWVQHGDHTALVTSGESDGHSRGTGGQIKVYFKVRGPEQPPAQCTFNGQPVSFG
jgi:Cellulose binding domain